MSHSLATIERSNLPSTQKSAIRRMYEQLGGGGALSRVKQHAHATGHAVRQGGEALLVGGLLGAANVQLPNGLDVTVPKVNAKVPVDAALGVVAIGASVALAHEDYATDLRNAGSTALAIFAFRKTAEFVAKKKGTSSRIAGEFEFGSESSDPIVAYAERMR